MNTKEQILEVIGRNQLEIMDFRSVQVLKEVLLPCLKICISGVDLSGIDLKVP